MNIFSLRYKHSISIELKNGACHLKEHPKISRFTKFDGYWFKPKGMVHFSLRACSPLGYWVTLKGYTRSAKPRHASGEATRK